eukprot:sb/3476314/
MSQKRSQVAGRPSRALARGYFVTKPNLLIPSLLQSAVMITKLGHVILRLNDRRTNVLTPHLPSSATLLLLFTATFSDSEVPTTIGSVTVITRPNPAKSMYALLHVGATIASFRGLFPT